MARPMSQFETNLLWRFIAPLSIACIISAGGSIYTVAKLQVTVDSLQQQQLSTASEKWVSNKIKFLRYLIQDNAGRISVNSDHIEKNRDRIEQINNADKSAALMPWRTAPDKPPKPVPVKAAAPAPVSNEKHTS